MGFFCTAFSDFLDRGKRSQKHQIHHRYYNLFKALLPEELCSFYKCITRRTSWESWGRQGPPIGIRDAYGRIQWLNYYTLGITILASHPERV